MFPVRPHCPITHRAQTLTSRYVYSGSHGHPIEHTGSHPLSQVHSLVSESHGCKSFPPSSGVHPVTTMKETKLINRFMPFLTYLPHAYPQYAASVLASNDFFRSMMGAGMPLAARPLFNNLGIDWGNTLLGCLTVVFIPIPFVLYRYGPWLRSKSPMALHDEDIEDEKKNPMV